MADLEKEVKTKPEHEIKLSLKEMEKDIQVPDDFDYITSEPETENNKLTAITENEAAIILFKEMKEIYNICICEGNKYMKVSNLWINDER